jgi:hypothetical protein
LNENKKHLNEKQFKSIKLRLNDRKFLISRLMGNTRNAFKRSQKKNILGYLLKNLFILLTPNFLLKRLLRF